MKHKRLGLLGTIIFHALLLGILFLCAFHTPLPLPQEKGILINFGNSNKGKGSKALAAARAKKKHQPNQRKKTATTRPKTHKTKSKKPQILTQKKEKAPSLPSSAAIAQQKKRQAEKIKQQKRKAEQERKERERIAAEKKRKKEAQERQAKIDAINQRAKNVFGKGAARKTSQGKSFASGNQGKLEGNPQSEKYNGKGLSNQGVAYDLSGRTSLSIPKPEYNLQESGKVVVEITVNKTGKVVNARPGMSGTTTTNRQLWQIARKAALKAKFNEDKTAPAIQQGTITYNFELN